MLDERKRKILKAIIEDFVLSAEPVGSRTISKKHDLGVSPATIRNEMCDLEELGYIEQPHTSAGRVPSIKGYRFYVDHLMDKDEVDPGILSIVASVSAANEGDQIYDYKMQRVARLLTEITNYPVVITTAKKASGTIKCLQIIPVSRQNGILVVINDKDEVEHHTLVIPEDITRDELDIMSQLLTAKMKGKAFNTIDQKFLCSIEKEISKYREIWLQIWSAICTHRYDDDARLYIDGSARIIKYPEFQNLDRLASILSLFEEPNVLRGILHMLPEGNGIAALIGNENSVEGFANCSIVGSDYQIDDERGRVCIIGPTRMDYRHVYSVIDLITANMVNIINGVYNR